jgi:signal transduction histidine kinase
MGIPSSSLAKGYRVTQAPEGMAEYSLATLPASAGHRRLTLAVIAATVVAYIAVIPFASMRLPQVDSFIPSLFSIIFVADLVTAVLLFGQFGATGLRAVLVLACGYLFSSLIVVAHMLTYPGAFSPTGLLGAGSQTAAWLNPLWRFGLSAGFAAYAVLRLRDEPLNSARWAPRSAIPWGVVIVLFVVASLVLATTAGSALLPALLSDGRITLAGRVVSAVVLAMNLTAVFLLMRTRGRSILDAWLAVSAAALAAESAFILFVITQRYDLSFYAVRLISFPVSKVVLIALLWELLRLYTNLAISHRQLREERANRLSNAASLMAVISHEVRQPLVGIGLLAYSGQKSLEQPARDVGSANRLLGETSKLLGEIRQAASRANEVFDTFLRVVKGGRRELQAVDINELTLEAVDLLKKSADDHKVTIVTKLTPDLPVVQVHRGQLREVFLNLMQNAIEAMAPVVGKPRVVSIETARLGRRAVSISLQDTGPGIEPEGLASLFDPFVTTKADGTGLGLAICKMIVDQHGGRISATSGDNGGAHFEIILPTRATSAVAAARSS